MCNKNIICGGRRPSYHSVSAQDRMRSGAVWRGICGELGADGTTIIMPNTADCFFAAVEHRRRYAAPRGFHFVVCTRGARHRSAGSTTTAACAATWRHQDHRRAGLAASVWPKIPIGMSGPPSAVQLQYFTALWPDKVTQAPRVHFIVARAGRFFPFLRGVALSAILSAHADVEVLWIGTGSYHVVEIHSPPCSLPSRSPLTGLGTALGTAYFAPG